jgi:hypothetical protein
MVCNAPTLLIAGADAALTGALMTYPPTWDEVFNEVRSRLVVHGAASKLDLAALVTWKHIQNAPWMTNLLQMPDVAVRAASAAAFAPTLADQQRVDALASLPGFGAGGEFTSVLLAAWNPIEYGVYDTRVQTAKPRAISAACTCDWTVLTDYWDHLRRMAAELSNSGASWTPRMVDQAFFRL